MKKIFYLTIISLGFILVSCDYVSNPFPEKNANISNDTSLCPTTFPIVTTHIKKILIEDYTGHICPNCPRAPKKIHVVDSTFPGQIIDIAIHCGGLASPQPGFNGTVSTSFTSDFRTSVGNVYDGFFKASQNFQPSIMLNRKYYDATNFTHLMGTGDLLTNATTIAGEVSAVDLQLSIYYNASTRKVYLSVRDSLIAPLSGSYRLVTLISQDSIIDWQVDVDQSPQEIQNYVHRHMLRDALTPTGAWGEPLIGGGASAGLTQIRHFAYTIPASYNNIPCDVNQCNIVAFIYNMATYEVIQSEEIKVIP